MAQIIRHVKEQTPEICMTAVQQNGLILEHVKEQTPELCMAAVQKDPWALEHVKEQTLELCMTAIQQDGRALKYVKKQTPEICMTAVQQTQQALKFIKDKQIIDLFTSWITTEIESTLDCPVCYERKVNRTTPCNHGFCSECVQDWVKDKSSCPMCRSVVIVLWGNNSLK